MSKRRTPMPLSAKLLLVAAVAFGVWVRDYFAGLFLFFFIAACVCLIDEFHESAEKGTDGD